MNFTSS